MKQKIENYFTKSTEKFEEYKQKIGYAKATFLSVQFIFDYSNINDQA